MSIIQEVNPHRCRMWDMHDRLGEEISADSCRSLIESIKRHGQRQPVLGRPARSADAYQLELIYGARRLFASRHLNRPLLVNVQEMDDRMALIEMDIENRVRADISPYERGLSYKRWLREGYFASQSDVAKALGVSEAQVSRLLRFAELPAAIVDAFPSPRDIREEWAVALAKECKDSIARQAIIRRARASKMAKDPAHPQKLFDFLINGKKRAVAFSTRHDVIKDACGTPLFRVGYRAKTVHLILPREKMTTELLKRIAERLMEVLDAS